MLRALTLLALLAPPVAAQDAGQCIGLADGLAWLDANGFTIKAGGVVANGRLAIYTHESGRFLVVALGDEEACIAAQGQGWDMVKPNA